MAYAENTKIKDSLGQVIDPAQNDNVTLLRRIFQLLKPLAVITGGGSNRLNVDVNAVTAVTTVTTVTTCSTVTNVTNLPTLANVTTVAALNNLVAIGNIPGFDLMKAASRTAYNSGIRSNIT
jgi:hypothetical protein